MKCNLKTFDGLLTYFEETHDYDIVGVIADHLEEEGQTSYIAWRWMARWERRPNEIFLNGKSLWNFNYDYLFHPNDKRYVLTCIPFAGLNHNLLPPTTFLKTYSYAIQSILIFANHFELPWDSPSNASIISCRNLRVMGNELHPSESLT